MLLHSLAEKSLYLVPILIGPLVTSYPGISEVQINQCQHYYVSALPIYKRSKLFSFFAFRYLQTNCAPLYCSTSNSILGISASPSKASAGNSSLNFLKESSILLLTFQ